MINTLCNYGARLDWIPWNGLGYACRTMMLSALAVPRHRTAPPPESPASTGWIAWQPV